MGVLQSHGYFGKKSSIDLNRVLKAQKLDLLKNNLSEIIKKKFEMENNSILRNKQIDSFSSVSTCVSVIFTLEN